MIVGGAALECDLSKILDRHTKSRKVACVRYKSESGSTALIRKADSILMVRAAA